MLWPRRTTKCLGQPRAPGISTAPRAVGGRSISAVAQPRLALYPRDWNSHAMLSLWQGSDQWC